MFQAGFKSGIARVRHRGDQGTIQPAGGSQANHADYLVVSVALNAFHIIFLPYPNWCCMHALLDDHSAKADRHHSFCRKPNVTIVWLQPHSFFPPRYRAPLTTSSA